MPLLLIISFKSRFPFAGCCAFRCARSLTPFFILFLIPIACAAVLLYDAHTRALKFLRSSAFRLCAPFFSSVSDVGRLWFAFSPFRFFYLGRRAPSSDAVFAYPYAPHSRSPFLLAFYVPLHLSIYLSESVLSFASLFSLFADLVLLI